MFTTLSKPRMHCAWCIPSKCQIREHGHRLLNLTESSIMGFVVECDWLFVFRGIHLCCVPYHLGSPLRGTRFSTTASDYSCLHRWTFCFNIQTANAAFCASGLQSCHETQKGIPQTKIPVPPVDLLLSCRRVLACKNLA